MASGRRSQLSSASKVVAEEIKAGVVDNDVIICDDSPVSEVDGAGLDVLESARVSLRKRWELASVINFLNVFGPVIGDELKMSAEEIETGLINPDKALARLHVLLLKGIPPASKHLNDSDAWVIVLCKKLKEWWRWVAEGNFPLSPSNGEEMHKYKEVDPSTRLLILKALCELRAVQDDVVLYVNDALKNGTDVSLFRKNRVGQDACGATYWCDNDAADGFRLYKEVVKKDTRRKPKENGFRVKPNFTLQWDTIATNIQEFRQIVEEFSSSKSPLEVAIGRTIENGALSLLEKVEKRKERALKKQEREAMLMRNYGNSLVIGITRSCRNRRPVTYTFDDYDQAIDEALNIPKRRKVINEVINGDKLIDNELEKGGDPNNCIQSSDTNPQSENYSAEDNDKNEGSQYNTDGSNAQTESDETDEDYDGEENVDEGMNGNDSDGYAEKIVKVKKVPSHMHDDLTYKHFGSRWSTRLANTNGHLASQDLNANTMTIRQRPARNRVSDSEGEDMPENES